MPDGQPPSPAPPAPTGDPQGGQPPAPVLTPPPNPPAGGQQPPANDQPPANGGEKTFTQADLDRIINERLDKQKAAIEKSFGDKLAGLFGSKPEGDGQPSPEQILAQAKQITEQAQARANAATARSFVQAAKVRPDRVDTIIGMVDLKTALQGVDVNDATAVDAAIKAAVDAKAAEFPEWKEGAPLPPTSGGDRQQNNSNGKRIYTRAELQQMSQRELAAIASDLTLAHREGRIK